MGLNTAESILHLQNLVKVYHTGAGDFVAINNINLDIRAGEFVGIIGKSGAGKTTLLNTISGVSEITSGEVLFRAPSNGVNPDSPEIVSIRSLSEDDLASWRGRTIGIVYQSFELMPQLNLLKNIMLPQDFAGTYHSRISAKQAMELLDIVELTEHAFKLPAQISGGQKQRVAIARALVNDPPLILADEPTGNLDTVTAERIFQIFEKLVKDGKTIIMVTHDRNLAARFSRQVYISDGELVSRDHRTTYEGDGDHPQGSQQVLIEQAINQAERLEIPSDGRQKGDSTHIYPSVTGGHHGESYTSTLPGSNGAAVILRDVVKTYENAAGKFPALKGINLQMNYGQFISIVGKSGSGKSTLLNMLTGIDHPTSGEVIVGGQDIYHMSESKRALWRGRNVGIVFQFFQLLPTLTLLENTMLPMDYCDVYPAGERPSRAMEFLKMVGLEDQADKLPSSVSSGQQQGAAIARALANDPPIIMADEPTGNLDSRSADKILGLFSDMARRGKTILIVTHDPSFTTRTDQTVILSDGEIIDDVVARALPLLNHPQMLQATHMAEKRLYQPGSIIIEQGQQVDHLFMIINGEVDVVLKNPGCPEISLARLGKGQFFGEVELIHNEDSIASVRAASRSEVELSLLPKEEFYRLLDGSPQTMDVIETVANKRLEENLAKNGGCE
ncbi:MAG: ATP-binding cassette domain-containing protein [Anaerolineales bacterium]